MKKPLKITLDNDEQVVLIRLVQKKLEACQWVLEKKKPDDLENLLDKIKIYTRLFEKLESDEEKEAGNWIQKINWRLKDNVEKLKDKIWTQQY